MSEETKEKLKDLAEVFPTLPPFVQGRIIGTIETAQAMRVRGQPLEQVEDDQSSQ